jgi:hypothetical protein
MPLDNIAVISSGLSNVVLSRAPSNEVDSIIPSHEAISPTPSNESNSTSPSNEVDSPGPSIEVDSIISSNEAASLGSSNVVVSSGPSLDLSNVVLSPSNEVNSTSFEIGVFRGTVQQFNQSLILHQSVKSLDVDQVKVILENCKEQGIISKVINFRTPQGTNPVGIAFLQLPTVNAIEIATIFARYDEYNINDYLNNRKYMDSSSTPQNIGGTTLLQNVALVAARLYEQDIGDSLGTFFGVLRERMTHIRFNPNFPSQHPDKLKEIRNAHLNSTEVIVEALSFRSSKVKDVFLTNLEELITIYRNKEFNDVDANSRSKDKNMLMAFQNFVIDHLEPNLTVTEEDPNYQRLFDKYDKSYAVFYGGIDSNKLLKLCQRLNQNLAGKTDDEKKLLLDSSLRLEQMMVPFFHGVPLMESMYSNADRRTVRDAFYAIIHKLLAGEDLSEREKTVLTVHSRTATASAGFQTLADLVSASDDQLEEIELVEDHLEDFLSNPERENTDEALKEFFINFKEFNTKEFWKNLRGGAASVPIPVPALVSVPVPVSVPVAVPDPAPVLGSGTTPVLASVSASATVLAPVPALVSVPVPVSVPGSTPVLASVPATVSVSASATVLAQVPVPVSVPVPIPDPAPASVLGSGTTPILASVSASVPIPVPVPVPNPAPHDSIVKYRAPIISTSKLPDHAMRYAFGRNVESDKGEVRLLPHYINGQQPRHRLAGFLYVSWLSLAEVAERLEKGTLVDVNQRFAMSHNLSRIQHQEECAFLGKIDSSQIVGVIPIVFPDVPETISKEDANFYTGIFGFNPSASINRLASPRKSQNDLQNSPNVSMNLTGFERLLYHSYANLAHGLLTAMAKKEEKMLVTFRRDQALIPYNVTWYNDDKKSGAKHQIDGGLAYQGQQPLWKELCKMGRMSAPVPQQAPATPIVNQQQSIGNTITADNHAVPFSQEPSSIPQSATVTSVTPDATDASVVNQHQAIANMIATSNQSFGNHAGDLRRTVSTSALDPAKALKIETERNSFGTFRGSTTNGDDDDEEKVLEEDSDFLHRQTNNGNEDDTLADTLNTSFEDLKIKTKKN